MYDNDYARIEQAMWFMEGHFQEQPSLEEMAASVDLSKYHFQRLFTRWAGISPGRFLQCLTLNHAKDRLESSHGVLDASLDAGLSGPGRLHDLFVTHEAVTPGEFKRNGEGLQVGYGFHLTPFGDCLLAVTERGICGLSFVEAGGRAGALLDLQSRLHKAEFREETPRTGATVERIFAPSGVGYDVPLRLLLHGTNFQVKVWEALLRIPAGMVVSYQDVAAHIGNAGAVRAVGRAASQNSIAYLIPCHRVIRKVGLVGDYRWGAARKRLMLAWESARAGQVSGAGA